MPDQDIGKQHLEAGFWVGDWFVDPRSNLLSRAGETCRVEPKVMHVLECLAEQPMRTVTKEAFMQEVWNGTVVTDDALSRCISELRKVFGDSPRKPRFIETIRKSGYRLIAPITYAADEPEPNRNDQATAGETSEYPFAPPPARSNGWTSTLPAQPDRASSSKPLLWSGSLLAVALAAFLWLSGAFDRDTEIPFRTVPFTSLPGEELQPAPSPDGEQIAFVWDGEAGDNCDLYVKQVGTETLLRLTDHPADESSPAWSPSGKSIAFVRCENDQCGVFVMPAIGGTEREVAALDRREIEGLVWSPDGKTLAYSAQSEPGEAFSIYLLSTETMEEHRLTSPPASYLGDLSPAFSPSGERLAFMRSVIDGVQDVYVVSIEGTVPRQLTSDNAEITGLDWTADGSEIVFASNRGGASSLWRVPLSGGTPVWITTAGEGVSVHAPSISRAGDRLAYEQRVTETNIWQLQRSGRGRAQPQRLISSTRWDSNPAVSPDGERIVFASKRSGSQEIWISDRDGSNSVRLTFFDGPFAGMPRWSPDGSLIAFDSRGESHADVYVTGTAGDLPRPLTTSQADDVAPSWSHDGEWIYFSSNRSGRWQIWRMPAAGGEANGGQAVQVTRNGGRMALASPDGQWLYYAKSDTAGIWRTPISAIPSSPHVAEAHAPAGSTGTTDAAVAAGSLTTAEPPAGPENPVATDTTAAIAFEEELVLAHLAPSDVGNWTVLENGIYFIRRRETGPEINFLSFADGLIYDIASLEDIPEHPSFAVSPDGGWFLYTQVDRSESDILLVEEFR